MTEDETGKPSTWLERIGHFLLGEPNDREELIDLLRDCQERNLLDIDALSMIEGVLEVSEMRVTEIMVPRSKMVIVGRDQPLEEILGIVNESRHSRYPVVGDTRDDVVGILLAKDLLSSAIAANKSEKFNIRDILRAPVFVPESKRLDTLLKEFRRNRNHLAIVVDEYGGIVGLVTIEDVLEQIVGEIEDEHDITENASIRKHKNNNYSVKAFTPIEEFNKYFQSSLNEEEFDTIGGLVMQAFGHLPKRGESIIIENMEFTILRANNRRVLLLRVIPNPSQEEESAKDTNKEP